MTHDWINHQLIAAKVDDAARLGRRRPTKSGRSTRTPRLRRFSL